MLHPYTPKDSSQCLRSRNVVFIGDSVTRNLFFQFANMLDHDLPLSPPNNNQKHVNHTFNSSWGTEVSFIWDPFLNETYTTDLLKPTANDTTTKTKRPALLVLGSGLWYLRYPGESGGLSAWRTNTATLVSTIMAREVWPADLTVMLPVGRVIPAKLSGVRAATMHPSDIDAMNSDLYHRIYPSTNGFDALSLRNGLSMGPVVSPRVFNEMLDADQTEDGLHFDAQVVKAQASILMNLRCNDGLPKTYPLSKTCCNRYPTPSLFHAFALLLVFIWGPFSWLRARKTGMNSYFREILTSVLGDNEIPALTLSAGALLIYVADRTGLWLKEQKQFDFWAFTFLSLVSVIFGVSTIRKGDKDMGFLNRDQTDEWKGWMQLAILIYHFFGASKISGIYNPIRTLVASYLFMSGYGHTTFYLRKADFSFTRVAQIMVRLNLITVLLAYTMDTDYMFYYFAPLVSMWYLIIYATLFAGSRYNERTAFLLGKIFLSASFVTWFFEAKWPLELLFGLLKDVFNIQWSAKEWTFRVTLDLWIVYVGMLTAFAVIKIREYQLTDHPMWPATVKVVTVVSAFIILWFFAFELMQESKFTYNAWHPYISPFPVLAFVVLRNANATLRSAVSKAFVFVGKCSLELFIVQYHFWLAGDTKGVLLIMPGTKWRPVNFVLTSFVFVYLCHRIANATAQVTTNICSRPQQLPTVQVNGVTLESIDQQTSNETESIPLANSDVESGQRKDLEGNPLPAEPDTPVRPRPARWLERLADGPLPPNCPRYSTRINGTLSKLNWVTGLEGKVIIFLCCLWFLNVMWTYPE
ncbi:hypothetical protein AGABI2DRAFT_198117 [Agaricus bisporus var. bisporus H97]|uniref:hypothetical protein n=1 Tax=Agaricus bisporus var. bisporus (strain H97 / ATCC MYA-4626 / FGSC 10389) TaxID=936046 RepID=UPI00029F7502|nr:hypothetical protein AGABI2DRAFT_198117 [Agaricus bisporus var. bisporus H97]EKV51705.1 hypothetical protein AGABI2DRAFT_198117 [Agaricus bisporus var. bisporus H97]